MFSSFDEDLGIYLVQIGGLSEGAIITFRAVSIMSIAPCGPDLCTSTLRTFIKGTPYAASFDFTGLQVANLLHRSPQIKKVACRLAKGESAQLDPVVLADVIASIGPITFSRLQSFRPFLVNEVTVHGG